MYLSMYVCEYIHNKLTYIFIYSYEILKFQNYDPIINLNYTIID